MPTTRKAVSRCSRRSQLALFYPVLLTIVAIGVVIGLMTYVVPQVVQVFENIGQELPVLTRALIAVSKLMRSYGLLMLLLLAVAGGFIAWVLSKEGPKRRFHATLLHLPLIGRLERGINAGRFARTFSIVTASGVPVLEGLRIASEVMSNLPMREAVEGGRRGSARGGTSMPQWKRAVTFHP